MTHTVGIVLRRFKTGEADRMLVILTRDQGKIIAVARAVRRTKSKLSGHLEPFMETKLYLAEGKRGIWTVAGAELLGKRTLSVDGLSLASRAAELADKVMPSSEPNQVIYELFADFLKNLEVSEHPKTLLFEYELHLLAESGFRPVTDRCAVCSKGLEGKLVFSPGHGGVVHVGCLRGGEQAFPITAQAAGLLVPGADSLELEAALPELRKIWDHYLAYVLSHSFRSDKFIQSLSAISEAHERT